MARAAISVYDSHQAMLRVRAAGDDTTDIEAHSLRLKSDLRHAVDSWLYG